MKRVLFSVVALLPGCSSSPSAPLAAAEDGYRIPVGVYQFSASVPQGRRSQNWDGTLTITGVTDTGLEGEWDARGLEPLLSSTPDTEEGRGRFFVKGFGNLVDPFGGTVERFSLEMKLVPVRDSDVVDCTELVWRQATVVAQPGECKLVLSASAASSVESPGD
ncbi:MAG: hypothetical protein ACC682_14215 [Gemmatimonadota bacterium]